MTYDNPGKVVLCQLHYYCFTCYTDKQDEYIERQEQRSIICFTTMCDVKNIELCIIDYNELANSGI